MAAIINTKAIMEKSALTSFMSEGALNKGVWSIIVINYIKCNLIILVYFLWELLSDFSL